MNNIPRMIMMMGLPGSGKSTLAAHISVIDGQLVVLQDKCDKGTPIIHSSDDLREELYGNASIQGDNNKLFVELHKRIKSDLRSGKDVIYDATNINKKLRISFLNELKNISCQKVCVAVMTPFESCIENNKKRERIVPDRVIRKMYKNWQPPHFHEGFDEIHFAFLCTDGGYINNMPFHKLVDIMDAFDQENSHHTLSLGEHCRRACQYCYDVQDSDRILITAAYLHDIGKLETKTRINSRGVDDGNCHYYQHHSVGAYMAMFYLTDGSYTIEDQCDIINMIYYHMHPYMAWKQSEKALKRDKDLLGEELFTKIMMLHEADLAAH